MKNIAPLRLALAVSSLLICSSHYVAAASKEANAALRSLDAALARLDAQEPLTSADHTALKKAAAERTVESFRVCGDPGNMPLSNMNREGFQNKVIEIVAAEMATSVTYFWRPYLERGITRQTFDSNDCDVLLDIPEGYERVLTTLPIYRTTYVLAYRNDKGIDITSLDDPKLKQLKVGVFQTSGLRSVLAKRGVRTNVSLHVQSHNPDLKPENQPWRQVQKVIDGELDIAGVWGPFAGWLKTMKGAPLVIQPVNLMEDQEPLEFDLSIGLRRVDYILKYKIELALEARKAEIEKVLRDFGVPLVSCSRCFVAGDIPAHGTYLTTQSDVQRPSSAADQEVTQQRLEDWLKDGADLTQELANAVLAGDASRVRFLVSKGADVNQRDAVGYAPLQTAARNRQTEIVSLLLDLKADVNARDSDGVTPLMHAVMRDHAPTIKVLAEHGAKLDILTSGGHTPLAIAIAEDKYKSAMALIDAGAPVATPSGEQKLTPLMVASGKTKTVMSLGAGKVRFEKISPKDPGALDVVRALIEKGADVNAVSGTGVTALILAAAHNNTPVVGLLVENGAKVDVKAADGRTAAEIAKANGNEATVSLLRLIGEARPY